MRKIITYISLITILLSSVSCVKSIADENQPTKETKAAEIDLSFTMQLPGNAQSSSTKAMNSYSDNKVARVDLLVFRIENGKEIFDHHTSTKTITTVSGFENLKKFTAKIQKKTNVEYRFVILTNLPDAQGDALSSIADTGIKDKVLATITVENINKWKTDGFNDGDFTPIPMWGESNPVIINSLVETNGVGGIILARMLAKIDVAITTSEAEAAFKLKEVHLYNRKTRGQIAPAPAHWISNSATKATVPADNLAGNPLTIMLPLEYTVTNDKSISDVIYTFEAASPGQNKYSDATCVVVGGIYGSDTDMSYYRLDFNNSDKTNFRDILRNHTYKVNITKVTGRGQDTSIDAFNTVVSNISAEILDWETSQTINSVSDGQFILNISKGLFNFDKDSRSDMSDDNKVSILTDYTTGWIIKDIKDIDGNDIQWLKISSADRSGQANTEKTISIISEKNDSGDGRTGYIYVEAGRLKFQIKVVQSILQRLALSIKNDKDEEITELNFLSYAGMSTDDVPSQSFTVRWTPFILNATNNPCNFSQNSLTPATPLTYASVVNSIPVDGSLINNKGAFTYDAIKPTPFTLAEVAEDGTGNPFLEKTSRVEYRVSNDISMVSKYLTIRQVNYAAVPEPDPFYLLNGSGASFKIKSNSSWKVTVHDDPAQVVEYFNPNPQKGGYDTETGQNVNFTLKDKINNPDGLVITTVTFKIECTDPNRPFDTRYVTIDCFAGMVMNYANTYMATPNGMGLIIPIDHYMLSYDSYNKQVAMPIPWITPLQKIKAKLIWTDHPKGVHKDGAVRAYKAVGRGHNAYVFVAPGSSEGNAVISAVDPDANIIRWSWNIWVTKYNPYDDASVGAADGPHNVTDGKVYRLRTSDTGSYQDNNIFMDRNIGAIGTDESDVNYHGVFFQYGRHNPVIHSSDWSGTGYAKIYDETGTETTHDMVLSPSTGINVDYSVTQPKAFLKSAGGDWSKRLDNIWMAGSVIGDGSVKSVYDPCPYGWHMTIYQFYKDFSYSPRADGKGYDTSIGFIPNAGLINYNTGAFTGTGTTADFWSVNSNGFEANVIRSGIGGNNFVMTKRGTGAPVRCVRYNPEPGSQVKP